MTDKNDIKMTQVDCERQIVKHLPRFTEQELKEVTADLASYIESHSATKNFLLLSNEIKYYTIFRRDNILSTSEGVAEKLMQFFMNDSFLSSLGELKVLKREESGAIAIWIGETFFLLFNADQFFVSV